MTLDWKICSDNTIPEDIPNKDKGPAGLLINLKQINKDETDGGNKLRFKFLNLPWPPYLIK